MSTSLWDESDPENELPAGWEEIVGANDSVLFHNYVTGQKQEQHPISGLCKQLPASLPSGWARTTDANGQTSFVHLPTGHVSPLDPRLAFAVPTGRQARARLISMQKFDKFSCIDEILLGKDLRGQFIVVSAAGCGLGLRISSKLASSGATVVCASPYCPTAARHCTDRSQIEAGLWWIPCDLSDLASVVRFGQAYEELGLPLHVCILAADVLPPCCKLGSGNRFFQIIWAKIISKTVPVMEHWIWHLIVQPLRFLWVAVRRLVAVFDHTRSTSIPSPTCCSMARGALTNDGFEWSMQHNYLAQVLLVQVLSGCLTRTDPGDRSNPRAVRIVLMSEEAHRMNLPLSDASIKTIPWQFTHIPTGVVSWLDQYRWSKLFQLLYLFELQRRLAIRFAHVPERPDRVPIVCACAQGSPLVCQCTTRWYSLKPPLWMAALLRVFWLLGLVFGPAVDQLAATPVLCAVDDSLNAWKLTETDPRRVSRALRTILYVHQCRPGRTLLTQYEPSHLLKASRVLWDATDTALTPYVRDWSAWMEFVGHGV